MDNKGLYEIAEQRMVELGLHLTLDAEGRILVIKRRVARGQSETLYRHNGNVVHVGSTLN